MKGEIWASHRLTSKVSGWLYHHHLHIIPPGETQDYPQGDARRLSIRKETMLTAL